MPAKITLREVLPVLWSEMHLDPAETGRTLNRAKFDQYMTTTETIVSPKTLDRMWRTLGSSRFAKPSPYFEGVLVLDVAAIRIVLDDIGTPISGAHTYHTHTLATTVQKVLPPREGA